MATPSTANSYTSGNVHALDEPGAYDVCVVGAGPAGLMLSVVAAKLGTSVKVVDERRDQTSDGIQPKTIETLQMLRISDKLMQTGVNVHDICL